MKHSKTSPGKVLGIGNALVDIMIALPDDNLLDRFGLPRGSMTLVDSRRSAEIYDATLNYQKAVTTGGSAANTIYALAALGSPCGYAGKIGRDELGKVFAGEFRRKGVAMHLNYGASDTGRVMAMVSRDSERTMATFLGSAAEMLPAEFQTGIFDSYSLVYIEGYLVQDHLLIETILSAAHSAGKKVAIDLSSYNIVNQNIEFLKRIMERYVDMVFANEEEALAYTGLKPGDAVKELAAICETAIVKTGKEGSLIGQGHNIIKIDPVHAAAIDTTGAGDSYAAGFLYGYMQGLNMQKCGDIASLVSSRTVEMMGARIPDSEWPSLLEKVQSIVHR